MENLQDKIAKALENFAIENHGNNRSAAARDLGLSNSVTLNHWIKKTRAPGIDALQPVFERLGWQLTFPGQSVRDFVRLCQVEAHDVSAWRQEKFDGQSVPESVLEYILVRKHLNSDISFSADILEELGVEGQQALLYIYPYTDASMFPTLQGGEQLLIDLRRKEVEDTQLYLIEDDGFKVRRLMRNFGEVVMTADSPSYSNVPLPRAENGHYPIVGQVVWIGKRIA